MDIPSLVVMLLAFTTVQGYCGTKYSKCKCDIHPNIVACNSAQLTTIPVFTLPTPYRVFVFHDYYIWRMDNTQLARIGPHARLLEIRFQKQSRCTTTTLRIKPTRLRILGLCERLEVSSMATYIFLDTVNLEILC